MTTKHLNNILKQIYEDFINDNLTNDDLVQIIELGGSLLNLQTRSDYKRVNKISYNGAKNHRTNRKIFNVNFIIDND